MNLPFDGWVHGRIQMDRLWISTGSGKRVIEQVAMGIFGSSCPEKCMDYCL